MENLSIGDKIEFNTKEIDGIFHGEIIKLENERVKIKLSKPIKYIDGFINDSIRNIKKC